MNRYVCFKILYWDYIYLMSKNELSLGSFRYWTVIQVQNKNFYLYWYSKIIFMFFSAVGGLSEGFIYTGHTLWHESTPPGLQSSLLVIDNAEENYFFKPFKWKDLIRSSNLLTFYKYLYDKPITSTLSSFPQYTCLAIDWFTLYS